jgi:hypothetical protein
MLFIVVVVVFLGQSFGGGGGESRPLATVEQPMASGHGFSFAQVQFASTFTHVSGEISFGEGVTECSKDAVDAIPLFG